ncbi:MAG: 6,7-dimethyl-8-ribityllumazine synthase, partial [Bacteroidota bacterium]
MTHALYAFVKANWHADVVDRALDGFCQVIPTAQ